MRTWHGICKRSNGHNPSRLLELGNGVFGRSLPAQPSTPKSNESSTPGGSSEAGQLATLLAPRQTGGTGTVGGNCRTIAAGALGLGALLIRRTPDRRGVQYPELFDSPISVGSGFPSWAYAELVIPTKREPWLRPAAPDHRK